MPSMKLFNENCLDTLRGGRSNVIDSIVTDPPYGIKFMNKQWDVDCPSVEVWEECLRVLKPGGHLLSFSGTRMIDFIMGRIREAGFEVRDTITWLYGSGFPKSHNIGKKLDDWEGWGTALKPACEMIVVSRKPFKGSVSDNVLKHGTGGLNIDACRVGFDPSFGKGGGSKIGSGTKANQHATSYSMGKGEVKPQHPQGRWPANLILDEEAGAMLDEQSGKLESGYRPNSKNHNATNVYGGNALFESKTIRKDTITFNDKGGASRFFYCAKSSKRERNAGLEGMEERDLDPKSKNKGNFIGSKLVIDPRHKNGGYESAVRKPTANSHPCIKPIKLMEYLCKLVTPPKGTILDPFMGSGTTGIAARNLGFDFVGIEMNKEYFEIAKGRINANL